MFDKRDSSAIVRITKIKSLKDFPVRGRKCLDSINGGTHDRAKAMNGQARNVGRKQFSSETLNRFIEMARIGKSVREIVADTSMPSAPTWYRYTDADPLLAQRWAEALREGKAAKRSNTGA